MKVFKFSTISTFILTVVSGAGYFVFYGNTIASTFLIAIFGSAFLATITSLIGYHIDKKNTLIELYDAANSFVIRVWMNFSADGEKSIFQQRRDAENLMFEYQKYSGARSKLQFFFEDSEKGIYHYIFKKLDPSVAEIYLITDKVRKLFMEYIIKKINVGLDNEDNKKALMQEIHTHTAGLTKDCLDCFKKVDELADKIKLKLIRPNLVREDKKDE